MEVETPIWRATACVGELRLDLCAGAAPPGWPAGRAARLVACGASEASGAGRGATPLVPARGAERAYAVLAQALAADGATGVLRIAGGGEVRLASLGAALVLLAPEPALAGDEGDGGEELRLARALLRAMPRRLPGGAAVAGGVADGPPAPVLDLAEARAVRLRAS